MQTDLMQTSTLIEAFAILFREGLEALLVIAALAAFLRRAGAGGRISALYGGALAAIVASIGMAWIFVVWFDGVHNDLIEAGVIVLAAALLLYMSGWLFLRQDPRAWQADLNRWAGKALDRGTIVSLASIAFLAVFREGAETILFLYALASGAGGWTASLFAGLGLATVALVAVFVAMQWLAMRLPLRPIFLVTSAFLFLIAIKLVGEAIQELQEQLIVPVHNDGVPDLVYTLGLNPSWEALSAQAVIVVLALGWALSRGALRRERASLSAAE